MPTRRDLLRGTAAAAAAVSFPSIALSATGKPTVRIGFLDSFSGVFSDVAGKHKIGATIALADLNRRGGVRYELVPGDDTSKPAVATSELRRLVGQEGVDVIFGGTSSGSGLALEPLADELGIFNLSIGPFDSTMTGAKARALTYRYGLNARMALKPMANRLLALGHKWYFIQADYALGKDAYAQLSPVLTRAGGTEVGHDILPLGTNDFSSSMTKVQTSGADVLVLANSGVDAANAVHAFVQFGLQKKIHLAGINLEDFYYDAIPLDAVQGSTFSVLWTPDASDSARKLVVRLRRDIQGPISARHYYGYAALTQERPTRASSPRRSTTTASTATRKTRRTGKAATTRTRRTATPARSFRASSSSARSSCSTSSRPSRRLSPTAAAMHRGRAPRRRRSPPAPSAPAPATPPRPSSHRDLDAAIEVGN
jgi:branched-chain amino acid transport system substrate-binding protein